MAEPVRDEPLDGERGRQRDRRDRLRPRTGGDFTIVERTGERDIRVCGRFDAVVPTSHIALTLTDSSGVSVDIIPCASGCELHATTHGRAPERWRAMLDRLARLLG